MIRIVGRIVSTAFGFINEAFGNQEAVRNPGDTFNAEIGSDNRKVGSQIPFVSRRQRRARSSRIEAENRILAQTVGGVIALCGDEKAGAGTSTGESDTLGVRISGAIGIAQKLRGAPAIGGVGHPQGTIRNQPEEGTRAIAGSPDDGGTSCAFIREATEIAPENGSIISGLDSSATRPCSVRGYHFARTQVARALCGGRGFSKIAGTVRAAAIRVGGVRGPRIRIDNRTSRVVESGAVGSPEAEAEGGLFQH